MVNIVDQDNLHKCITVQCDNEAEANAVMDKSHLIGTMTNSYIGRNLYVYIYVADDVRMDEAIRMVQTVRIR